MALPTRFVIGSREINEINDLHPDLKITFTGSSLIQILNVDADLSRRVLPYQMAGLSFREFLHFYHNIECFVVNQLSVNHTVEYGKTQGDFRIDSRWTVEVGGHDKTFNQIADIPDSFILADNMEYPIGKKFPLWIVGFTY